MSDESVPATNFVAPDKPMTVEQWLATRKAPAIDFGGYCRGAGNGRVAGCFPANNQPGKGRVKARNVFEHWRITRWQLS